MQLSSRPIFIVGSPRSGTSIMAEALDAHPSIFSPHWETGLFVRCDDMLNGHLNWALTENKAAMPLERADFIAWIRESAESLFARFAVVTGKPRWAEKTPAHVFHMPLMQEVFPEAQFIHMVRNGRDVVRSLQQMPWAPRKTRWSIERWVRSVNVGRENGRKLPANQYTEVRYEEFLAEPRNCLMRLCSFLGEPFSEQMLSFHLPENNSWNVSLKPLQGAPVNRHKPLGALQRGMFSVFAGRLMRELGYK